MILQSRNRMLTAYYCPIHKVDDFPRTFPGTWKNCVALFQQGIDL